MKKTINEVNETKKKNTKYLVLSIHHAIILCNVIGSKNVPIVQIFRSMSFFLIRLQDSQCHSDSP